MKRLSDGLVIYADKLWTLGKSRKAGECWKTGEPFAKGDLVYRPITNGYDRMNRIRAEFFDAAPTEPEVAGEAAPPLAGSGSIS